VSAIGTITFLGCCCIDSYLYNQLLVIPPWNFFYFNIYLHYATLFGTQPFYWYFTIGAMTLFGLTSLYLLHMTLWIFDRTTQSLRLPQPLNTIAFLSVFYIVCLSCIQHKEFRFILVTMPGLHLCLGYYFYSLDQVHVLALHSSKRNELLPILCMCGLIPALYLGYYHQVL
jgi:phosphatidylinositol glycan class B